jgi:hypothetical protein
MKKEIFLIAFLFAAVALSGCTQTATEPETVLKYVCYDGTVLENPTQCPGLPDVNCEGECGTCSAVPVLPVTSQEEFIQGQIDKANYCSVKEDCVIAARKCPFGCNILVNKNELDKINRMIGEYKQTCNLTCASLRFYNCDLNECVETDFG